MSINNDAVSLSSPGFTNKTTSLQFLSNSEQYQMDSKPKLLPYFRRVIYQGAEDLETGKTEKQKC